MRHNHTSSFIIQSAKRPTRCKLAQCSELASSLIIKRTATIRSVRQQQQLGHTSRLNHNACLFGKLVTDSQLQDLEQWQTQGATDWICRNPTHHSISSSTWLLTTHVACFHKLVTHYLLTSVSKLYSNNFTPLVVSRRKSERYLTVTPTIQPHKYFNF